MTRPGERAQGGGKFDEDVMEKTLKAMFNSTFFWGQEDGVDSNGIHKRIKRGTSENGVPRLFFGAEKLNRQFLLTLEGKAFAIAVGNLPLRSKPRQSINNGCKTRKKRAIVSEWRTNPRMSNKS